MFYKLYVNAIGKTGIIKIEQDTITSFTPDPANTDYANFRKEILADEAQLQDAEGVIMADAKAYVASLL